jgi:IS30 family transposase
MSSYKQLTYAQRCQIEVLNKSGFSQQSIGDAVGLSQSSISRELKRNTGERGYRHQQAHRKSYERRHHASKATKVEPVVLELIARKLHQYWSPEQISGWLLEERAQCLSHESIYQHVWADKRGKSHQIHSFMSGGKQERSACHRCYDRTTQSI